MCKKIISIFLVILLCGCEMNSSVYVTDISHTAKENSVYEFFNNQIKNNEYNVITMSDKMVSTLQAGHYIAINRLIGNGVDQKHLNIFKDNVVSQNEMGNYAFIDLMIDENLLSEQEKNDLISKYKNILNKDFREYAPEINFYDLYYICLILSKISDFDYKPYSQMLLRCTNEKEGSVQKLQSFYCYCDLLYKNNDLSFCKDIKLKQYLIDAAKDEKDNYSDLFAYCSLIKMFDMREEIDNKFLDAIEKEIYVFEDNLDLGSLYIRLEILNEIDPEKLKEVRDYVIDFLKCFYNENSNSVFPYKVGEDGADIYYYPMRQILLKNILHYDDVNFISTLERDNTKLDLNDRVKNYYKVLYCKLNGVKISKWQKIKFKKHVKNHINEIMDRPDLIYTLNALGTDLNDLLDVNKLKEDLEKYIITKDYNYALTAIDFLNLCGYDKIYLQQKFNLVLAEINSLGLIKNSTSQEKFLLFVLDYILNNNLIGPDVIDNLFSPRYINYFPVISNTDKSSYLNLEDYFYYYSLYSLRDNFVFQFIR